MAKFLNTLIIVSALSFSFQYTESAFASRTLSPAKCAKLRVQLANYIAHAEQLIAAAINKYKAACPNGAVTAKCKKMKGDLDKYIAGIKYNVELAKKDYAKKCPVSAACLNGCQATYNESVVTCNAIYDPAVCGGNLVCEAGVTAQREECVGIASGELNSCSLSCNQK
jgi:hypothetical protein